MRKLSPHTNEDLNDLIREHEEGEQANEDLAARLRELQKMFRLRCVELDDLRTTTETQLNSLSSLTNATMHESKQKGGIFK